MRARLWLAPVLVFGVALAIYAATAPPGLSWAHASADGGDLITAARVRGVPHPSGYPTWTLLAALFSAWPAGTLAWRATLLSVVSGATAAALVAATVPWLLPTERITGLQPGRRLSSTAGEPSPRRSPPAVLVLSQAPAVIAGLALATVPLFWGQATVAEVYALHACLAAAALWALLRWHAGGDRRWAAAGGLFLGLGLGNHLTTVWLLPAAAILLWAGGGQSGRPATRLRAFVIFTAALAAGLLVYLYLPLAAAGDPPVNWGNPQTLHGLWWLVSGQLYRAYVLAVGWPDALGRLAGWSAELWRSFLPWGVAAALLGLATLFQRQRAVAAALLTSLLLGLIWAIGYDTSDSLFSLLPGWVILALGVGVGVAVVLDWLAEHSVRAATTAALAGVALVLLSGLLHWPQQNLRSDRAAEQFYREVLQHVQPGAVVLSAGDQATFALWYGRYGLGLRPDVALVSRDLWPLASYRATVASQHPALAGATPPASWQDLLAGQPGPLYLAQAGLGVDGQAAPPALAGYRLDLALAGDGWALWQLVPEPSF